MQKEVVFFSIVSKLENVPRVYPFCNFRGKDRSGLAEIPNFIPLLINPGYIITPQGQKKKPRSGCSDCWPLIYLIHSFLCTYSA